MSSELLYKEKIETMVNLFISNTMAYPRRYTYRFSPIPASDVDIHETEEHNYPFIKILLIEINQREESRNDTNNAS